MRRCRGCGAQVPVNSLTCPKCYREMPREVGDAPERDPRIALLLALIPGIIGLWGLGHIYMGLTERGLSFLGAGIVLTTTLVALAYGWFLIITIVCLVMASIIWLGLFILQAFEAWMLSNTGTVDWSSGFRFR